MKLSIIIPVYNTEGYLFRLLERLNEQMTDGVEVIVVDDGSDIPIIQRADFKPYPWLKAYVLDENRGVSVARNHGLDVATGDYVAFIDSDDLVSKDYLQSILTTIDNENPDYIYISWRGYQNNMKTMVSDVTLHDNTDVFPEWNLCCWNRIYKRAIIGNIRFNALKLIAEDAEFIRKIEKRCKVRATITTPIYYYRTDTPNSLTQRFHAGLLDTKRIVYYFPEVTEDMRYLLDEFREADKDAEVMLLTYRNDLPELQEYAIVLRPKVITATEARGEYTNKIIVLPKAVKTQVVIWTDTTYEIGGIETFIYYFCKIMSEFYDITVLYRNMALGQIQRLTPFVDVRRNDMQFPVECDTLIVNRVTDDIPKNIRYKNLVQMIHAMRLPKRNIPNRGRQVIVSQTAKDSWGPEAKNATVIHNPLHIEKRQMPLLLVSATRTSTNEKGLNRMLTLARVMEKQGVNYIWLCFTDAKLPPTAPKSMIRAEPRIDVIPMIAKADYLVQLSDMEGFCYAMMEALAVGTAVIMTPLGVCNELGVEDGKHGYIVPFDITDAYDTTRFLTVPRFDFQYDNTDVVARWREVLGNTVPTHAYNPEHKTGVQITTDYYDPDLKRMLKKGDVVDVTVVKAEEIVRTGFGRIVRM